MDFACFNENKYLGGVMGQNKCLCAKPRKPRLYIYIICRLCPEMGTRVLGLGLESDSSPDLAGLGLGLESFTSGLGLGLGLETCRLGLDSDSDRRDSTGLGKLHR